LIEQVALATGSPIQFTERRNTMKKYIHNFKAGDLVKAHGAVFRIIEDAKESNAHRPHAGHLRVAHGPSDCAWANGEWVSGQIIKGYFGPGQNWLFQGNFLAGQYDVE
jgi:hypothetical protein